MVEVFVKHRRGAPPSYYRLEAAGLRWLREATGGAPVPEVVSLAADRLTLARVRPASAAPADARRFGRELAATHASGASSFGEPPASESSRATGFIADLPLPFGSWPTFGTFYARARVRPYLDMLGTAVSTAQAQVFDALVERLEAEDPAVVGPAEPPARIHGDLWSGNVVWGADSAGDIRGWLIDPAAHGGHRETDLAMLLLFGAPHLSDILAGYSSAAALSEGWRQRVALHQVHPLLVHAALFGGDYLRRAAAAARAALHHAL